VRNSSQALYHGSQCSIGNCVIGSQSDRVASTLIDVILGLQNDGTWYSAAQQTVRHKSNNYRGGGAVSGKWVLVQILETTFWFGRMSSRERQDKQGMWCKTAVERSSETFDCRNLQQFQFCFHKPLKTRRATCSALAVLRATPTIHSDRFGTTKTALYLQCRSGVFSVNYKLNM
jgi:hypothetical protein